MDSSCACAHPRAFAIYKAELANGSITEKVMSWYCMFVRTDHARRCLDLELEVVCCRMAPRMSRDWLRALAEWGTLAHVSPLPLISRTLMR